MPGWNRELLRDQKHPQYSPSQSDQSTHAFTARKGQIRHAPGNADRRLRPSHCIYGSTCIWPDMARHQESWSSQGLWALGPSHAPRGCSVADAAVHAAAIGLVRVLRSRQKTSSVRATSGSRMGTEGEGFEPSERSWLRSPRLSAGYLQPLSHPSRGRDLSPLPRLFYRNSREDGYEETPGLRRRHAGRRGACADAAYERAPDGRPFSAIRSRYIRRFPRKVRLMGRPL